MPKNWPTTKEHRAIDNKNQDLVAPYADKLMRLVRKGDSGYRGFGAGR